MTRQKDAQPSGKLNSDYRKLYISETGEDIPEGYEVHHIDHNSKNNEIDNLVDLPKDLHKKYHRSYDKMQFISYHDIINEIEPRNVIMGNLIFSLYRDHVDEINDHITICQTVSEYITDRAIKVAGGYQNACAYAFRKIQNKLT